MGSAGSSIATSFAVFEVDQSVMDIIASFIVTSFWEAEVSFELHAL